MSFKSRKEEIMAKIAADEKRKANEAAYADMLARKAEMAKPCLYPDHKIPTTRRELVAAGLMSGAAYALTPSLLSMISSRAYGEELECKAASSGAKAPGFLQIEPAGGWSAAHQLAPGKNKNATFEPLTNEAYATLALGPAAAPSAVTMNTDFGVPIHPMSPWFAGLSSVMSAEALANTRIAFMPQASGDDSGNNQLQISKFVAKVQGLQYALTPLAGSFRSAEAVADPSVPLAPITDETGLANLVDPGLIATRLSKDAAIKIAEATAKLSQSKLKAFNQKDMPQQVNELIQCGYLGSKDLLVQYTPENLRASTDPMLTAAPFGALTVQQILGVEANQQALIMGKLLGDGLASGASIEMGGYDYHGRGRAAQDTRDTELGVVTGLALETAFRKNAPLFVAITSDGSVSSRGTGGDGVRYDFSADSGSRGGVIMLAITPAGMAPPEMKQGMVGAFTDSGAVDTSFLVTSNSPQLGALGIAYNYAAFAGKMSEFDKEIAGAGLNNPFNDKEYLAFAPKA